MQRKFGPTQIDGGFLSPGTPYYLRISAINSVGVGEALEADTEDTCGDVVDACSPRAPPPPPTAAKVSTTRNHEDGGPPRP